LMNNNQRRVLPRWRESKRPFYRSFKLKNRLLLTISSSRALQGSSHTLTYNLMLFWNKHLIKQALHSSVRNCTAIATHACPRLSVYIISPLILLLHLSYTSHTLLHYSY
jgi:hypothetical protein